MKKSIFKVGFLTTLILILVVSCTSPAEETTAKLPALTNKQKVANSSALPDVYYLYNYLLTLHHTNPSKYYALFGDKFDAVIY